MAGADDLESVERFGFARLGALAGAILQWFFARQPALRWTEVNPVTGALGLIALAAILIIARAHRPC